MQRLACTLSENLFDVLNDIVISISWKCFLYICGRVCTYIELVLELHINIPNYTIKIKFIDCYATKNHTGNEKKIKIEHLIKKKGKYYCQSKQCIT